MSVARHSMLAIGLFVTFAQGCGAGGDGATIADAGGVTEARGRFQALAAAVEQERVALGAPGVAVAVVEKGAVTFAQGFGSKDPDGQDPVKPTTLFRIGSCTKSLTAIAILQAVQEGKVGLDDPVIQTVPGFHSNRSPVPVPSVSLRHLLTHSGGILDYSEIDAPASEQTDAALEAFLTGRFADIGYIQSELQPRFNLLDERLVALLAPPPFVRAN